MLVTSFALLVKADDVTTPWFVTLFGLSDVIEFIWAGSAEAESDVIAGVFDLVTSQLRGGGTTFL